MKQCGWFSKFWHEIEGDVYDATGKPCIHLAGKWNESIYAKALDYVPKSPPETNSGSSGSMDDSDPEKDTTLSKKAEKEMKKQQKKEAKKIRKELKKHKRQFKKEVKNKLLTQEPIWVHTEHHKPIPPPRPPHTKYQLDWTPHTLEIVELTDFMKATLPPTDSRLRKDRWALERADTKTAAAAKHQLEEKQRAERRARERKQETYKPKYFRLEKDDDGQDVWRYLGGYWEEREKRIQQYLASNPKQD